MQIRLQGLPAECAEALQRLAATVRVIEVPAPRQNTRHDPGSKVVRIYAEVRLDEPPEPTAFAAAAFTVTSSAGRARQPGRRSRQRMATGGAIPIGPGTSVGVDGCRHQ
jgi:hypothetical protein